MPDSMQDHEHYVLARLLQQSADSMRRLRQTELSDIGVSTIEAATLLTIDDLGQQARPSRIAECVLRRPNSMTALLQRMERDGLVTKTHDLEQRNWARVELTNYGREVLEKVSVRATVHTVFSSLSASERDALKTILVHLRGEILSLLGEKKPPLPILQEMS